MNELRALRASLHDAQEKLETMRNNNATEAEFASAEREFRSALASYQAAYAEVNARSAEATLCGSLEERNTRMRSIVSEAQKSGGVRSFKMQRAATLSTVVADGGVPVTIGELLLPAELPTIYDKVGIQLATGVRGQLIWPVLNTLAEVNIAGEGLALGDTTIDFSKISATPQRVGISIEVSNEAVNDAAFDLVGVVTSQIHAALARTLNKVVIGSTAYGQMAGPYTVNNAKLKKVVFASDFPTYAELLQMKGKVLAGGIQMAGFAYIMNATTYSTLEATPITAGDSRMILEGGKIAGYPVFIDESAEMADGAVNAGCFGYAALNQHGDMHFIVDPYTGAKKSTVVFTLNADWSLTLLRGEAFVSGAKAGE